MRRIVKRLLPSPIHEKLSELKRSWHADALYRKLQRDWDEAIITAHPRLPRKPVSRLLIIPPDPGTLIGSLGDEAMIVATVEQARARNPDVKIDVIVGGLPASNTAVNIGLDPVDLWHRHDFLKDYAALLNQVGYDAVLVIGADAMDGYYSRIVSASLLAAADIAARSGIYASFLGFSFNETPKVELAKLFNRTDARVNLNIRDAHSLRRFQLFARAKAQLVADAAFSMGPGDVDVATRTWIEERRSLGKRVVGFNLHPMLIKDADAPTIKLWIQQSAEALIAASQEKNTSWLLLPHDYRSSIGDGVCLRPIFDEIYPHLGSDAYYLEGEHSAPVLKATVGMLDGAVTARMHLAVAALGMGVPVLCLTYQGKFEGLIKHFDLPGHLLLSPSILQEEKSFRNVLLEFIDELPTLQSIIQAKKADVIACSNKNFSFMLGQT